MRLAFAALACLGLLGATEVAAQGSYPTRTVRIIVPYPAGGAIDVQGRIVADKLSAKFGQPFVIENRPGAGGNIGADLVYRAAPDGHTLMCTAPGPLVVNRALYKELSYDPDKFVPISVLSIVPTGLEVRPDMPAKTVKELVELARKEPGKLTYGSQGNGTTSHLTAAMLQLMGKVEMTHVVYTGTTPALTDLMGSRIDMFFDNLAVSVQQHKAGTLRIMAVATDKRLSILPEVPTMIESGFPGFLSATWVSIAAPPGTPQPLAQQLSSAIADIMKMPDVRDRFAAQVAEPVGGTSQEMAALIKEELARWTNVIKSANVTLN